jgi:hypothetical protein
VEKTEGSTHQGARVTDDLSKKHQKKGGSKTRTGEVLRRLFADLPVAALL